MASLLGYVVDLLSFLWFRWASLASTAVETMRTDTFSGKPNGFHQIVNFVKTKRGDAKTMRYLFHHAMILWCTGIRILDEVLLGVTLEILYHTACDEFQIALRTGEANEWAAIDQWGT